MQQQQQPPPANVTMLCLQAQQVVGLPDAAEGRHIQLQLTPTTAAAVCRAGVADFHRQVLLLHCAPVTCIDDVQVTVTCNDHHHPAGAARVVVATVNVDLPQQLRRPSPSVLTFVLGVSATATAAGAVLSLTLHHRLLVTTRTGTGCSSLLRACLRLPQLTAGCCPPLPVLRTTNRQHQLQGRPAAPAPAPADDGDSSSSGFITIEKGTISRRRPPSDYLLTTDDDEADGNKRPPAPGPPNTCCWSLSSLDDDAKVENDFLAMLMLQEEDDDDDDLDQLDALIKDAEADLAAMCMAKPLRPLITDEELRSIS